MLNWNTPVAMRNNIELCTASDFCAINCHAFFDGNTLPEDSGQFVQNWVKQISEAAGGKITIVTESGWPHQGSYISESFPTWEQADPFTPEICFIIHVPGLKKQCLLKILRRRHEQRT